MTTHAPISGPAPSPASGDLEAYAGRAAELEGMLDDVAAVLDAIDFGDLLSAVPVDASDRLRHNSAMYLLDMARRRVAERDQWTGTDLSISLGCAADRARKAEAARGRLTTAKAA